VCVSRSSAPTSDDLARRILLRGKSALTTQGTSTTRQTEFTATVLRRNLSALCLYPTGERQRRTWRSELLERHASHANHEPDMRVSRPTIFPYPRHAVLPYFVVMSSCVGDLSWYETIQVTSANDESAWRQMAFMTATIHSHRGLADPGRPFQAMPVSRILMNWLSPCTREDSLSRFIRTADGETTAETQTTAEKNSSYVSRITDAPKKLRLFLPR
jgi:hypothetical protein